MTGMVEYLIATILATDGLTAGSGYLEPSWESAEECPSRPFSLSYIDLGCNSEGLAAASMASALLDNC